MALERLGQTVRLATDDATSDELKALWDAIELPAVTVSELKLTLTAKEIQATDARLTFDQGGPFELFDDWFDDHQAADLFKIGFEWNDRNESQARWMPQGISGTADAFDDGELDGRKFLVTSWHHDDNDGEVTDRGARVSFVDVTDWGEELPYRNVLLVQAVELDGQPSFETVNIHAGGIVWFQRYLYVADTKRLHVFDTERMRAIEGDEDDLKRDEEQLRIGLTGGRFAALGYRYVVPLVRVYDIESEEFADGVFSTLSLDRESDPPRLVVAKFISDDENDEKDKNNEFIHDHDLKHSVVLFYRLLPGGPLEGWDSGIVESDEEWLSNLKFVQGVFAKGDDIWFCQSTNEHQSLRRRSKTGAPGAHFDWADGGESLHFSPSSDHLWNLTEHADKRIVFCIGLDSVT